MINPIRLELKVLDKKQSYLYRRHTGLIKTIGNKHRSRHDAGHALARGAVRYVIAHERNERLARGAVSNITNCLTKVLQLHSEGWITDKVKNDLTEQLLTFTGK